MNERENRRVQEAKELCQQLFSFGHEDFVSLCINEMSLHSRKNHEYTSGGDAMGNFKRVSAIKKLYPGFPWDEPVGVALSFALKSFDAVLWGLATKRELTIETYTERLSDVGVYLKLMQLLLRAANIEQEQKNLAKHLAMREEDKSL